MIYYRKNTDPEMPLPEDFDILFFGESGISGSEFFL